MLVVHDEGDFDLGRLELKDGGGLAGHNGLRSIADHLGTQDFLRLRIGVGRPERGDRRPLADWVLANFEPHEHAEEIVASAADAVEALVADGLSQAQAASTVASLAAWRSSPVFATSRARRISSTAATADPLDVDDLARAAGLSRAHFSREFRRHFGESPHAYLLTRRLERAAALLRTTDRTVAEICFDGRPRERRLVHDELHAHVRPVADARTARRSRRPRRMSSCPAASCARGPSRKQHSCEKTQRARLH